MEALSEEIEEIKKVEPSIFYSPFVRQDVFNSEIKSLSTQMSTIEKVLTMQISTLDTKINTVEKNLNARIDTVEKKIDTVEKNLNEKIDTLGTNLNARIDDLNQSQSKLITMFGVILTALTVLIAVIQLWK